MNIFNSLSLLLSKFRYVFASKNNKLGKNKIIPKSEAVNFYMTSIQKEGFKSAYISDLTIQILYEGLLLDNNISKDFSDDLYFKMEDELKVPYYSLDKKTLTHVFRIYRKAFDSLDVAFINPDPRLRYISKYYGKRIKYLFKDSERDIYAQIPTSFVTKRVFLISDHPDLFKVQFVKLKSKDKQKYNYYFMAIDDRPIVDETDRTRFFESSDSISMALLNYSFDILLIHEDVYSLPIMIFVSKMNIPVFIMSDEVYTMYGIIKSKGEIPFTDDGIYLEDFEKESEREFTYTTTARALSYKGKRGKK